MIRDSFFSYARRCSSAGSIPKRNSWFYRQNIYNFRFSSVAASPVSVSESLSTKFGMLYKYIDPTAAISESSVEAFEMPAESRALLVRKGINSLFPIQASVWAEILEGRDLLARARTGTGKTLAFTLPILSKIFHNKSGSKSSHSVPGALIIAPTRELASQIGITVKQFAPANIRSIVCYGGVSINPQLDILNKGVDIVIGTPGRLADLWERGALRFENLQFIVLDEADFMLDLGFKAELETILNNVKNATGITSYPQMLLFSATVPQWVLNTARTYFQRPEKIFVDAVGETTIRTCENIKQVALAFRGNDLSQFVSEALFSFSPSPTFAPLKALVFCDTKRQASHIASTLFSERVNPPVCAALHGDLTQNQRTEALDAFKNGQVNVLIATDVAARGLDIADVDVVIQLNPPPMVETFIHRSGRTARAGKGGVNILIYNPEEHLADLAEIEKTAGFKFSRQALEAGRSLIIKDKDTFSQIVRAVSAEEKKAMEPTVRSFLEENPDGLQDTILALSALLHRSFPASFKITRSVLTGEKGFITLQFTPKERCQSSTAFIRELESTLMIPNVISKITIQRFSADKRNLIFDLPLEMGLSVIKQNELEESSERGEISPVLELPELSTSRLQQSTVSYGSMRASNSSREYNNEFHRFNRSVNNESRHSSRALESRFRSNRQNNNLSNISKRSAGSRTTSDWLDDDFDSI